MGKKLYYVETKQPYVETHAILLRGNVTYISFNIHRRAPYFLKQEHQGFFKKENYIKAIS